MSVRGVVHRVECPACGGAGGGPFGRPGSAWDVESYVCPRCQGRGVVREAVALARPLAKAAGAVSDGSARGPTLADAPAPSSDPTKRRSSA